MSRTWPERLVGGIGIATLLAAVGLALVSPPSSADSVPVAVAAFVVVLTALLALWKLLRRPGGDGVAQPPWTDDGAIVDQRPESARDSDPISGTELAGFIEEAAERARSEETVEAGVEAVRAPLREALVAALTQGGWDRERIDAALADGSWTDDPVAAAVLDERVTPPERSLRRRIWAWLFPAKAVRHRTGRAVGAVADAASAVLPPVVGQRAPRPVPVLEPTLDDLQRAADGTLRQAVEGRASVRAARYDKGGPDGEDADRADAETPSDGDATESGDPDRTTAGGGPETTESDGDAWPAATREVGE